MEVVAARDEVERAVELGDVAQLLLKRIALGVAGGVEQCLESLAGISARQLLPLLAIAGDRFDLAAACGQGLREVHALRVDLVALVFEDAVVVVGDQRAEDVVAGADARKAQQRQEIGRGVLVHARRRIGTVLHGFHHEVRGVLIVRLPEEFAPRGENILAAESSAAARDVGIDFGRRRSSGSDAERAPQGHIVRERGGALVVGVVTVVAVVYRRQTKCHRLAKRQIERRLQAGGRRAIFVLAIVHLGIGAELAKLRPLRGDRDHAAGGVLAEQRALRAAIHLDLLRVEHGHEL